MNWVIYSYVLVIRYFLVFLGDLFLCTITILFYKKTRKQFYFALKQEHPERDFLGFKCSSF